MALSAVAVAPILPLVAATPAAALTAPQTCGVSGVLTVGTNPVPVADGETAVGYVANGTACATTGAQAVVATMNGTMSCTDATGTGTMTLSWADGTRSVVPVDIDAATAAVTFRGVVSAGRDVGSRVVANLVAAPKDYEVPYAPPACGASAGSVGFPGGGTIVFISRAQPRLAVAELVFGFFSPTPASGTTASLEQLAEIQQNAGAAAIAIPSGVVSDPTSVTTVESPDDTIGTISPTASTSAASGSDTERGYLLRGHNKRSDFVYVADSEYPQHWHCNDEACHLDSEVKISFKETVNGLNSQTVQLTFYSKEDVSSPSIGWVSHYSAYCAVNIKNAIDKYCEDWKSDGADNPKFNTYYNGASTQYYFGYYMPATKFPMVNLQVTWSDGVQAIDRADPGQRIGYRYRGWDVCLRENNTRLCASTGDGT